MAMVQGIFVNREHYVSVDDAGSSLLPDLESHKVASSGHCHMKIFKSIIAKCAHLCFSFSHRSTAMTEPAQYKKKGI